MSRFRDCWSELGLEGPAEAREVRRAYARRLKQTRPEDDAAGFQRLREAYEEALARADAAARDPDEATEDMAAPVPALRPPADASPLPAAARPPAPAAGPAPRARDLSAHTPAPPATEADAPPPPEAVPDPAALAAEQRCRAFLERLWILNAAQDGEAASACLLDARQQWPLDEMAEVEMRLRQVCAFDDRTSGPFFRAADEVFGWAREPLPLAGEAARLAHALQARREYWRARERLDGKLAALSAALAGADWEKAAQLGARLEETLRELALDWREWLEPRVAALVAETDAMPAWLLERFHAAWGGSGDYARARRPEARLLEQRLEGERFWKEVEDVHSGKLAASWHYRRAIGNLLARRQWTPLWRWRSLYGLQQQMTRDMLLTMEAHFPQLLQRLDPRAVAWWRVQRPALGVYPERWIALFLFLSHACSGVVLANPGPWTAWQLPLFHLLLVPALLALRIWSGWHWSWRWRYRVDAWEAGLTRRLLPSRWREAVDQHYRLPEFLLRGALLAAIPALLAAVVAAGVAGRSLPWFWPLAWLLLTLGAQAWFLRRALRGELPPLATPGQRFAVAADDKTSQDVPWMAWGIVAILVFVILAKALEYVEIAPAEPPPDPTPVIEAALKLKLPT